MVQSRRSQIKILWGHRVGVLDIIIQVNILEI